MKIYTFTPGGIIYLRFFKCLIIMKLVVFLIFVSIFQLHARNFAQKVTLSEKNASLVDVFRKIKAQTNYNLICQSDVLRDAPTINIEVENVPLKETLDQLLSSNGLSYVIEENSVIVKKRSQQRARSHVVVEDKRSVQQQQVTGKVEDENGEVMMGVTVAVKGQPNIGTTTDANGMYVLNVPSNAVLTFSFVGHLPKDIEVGNREVVDVVLAFDEQGLEDVVVVGFGKQRKESVIGAITSIKPSKLKLPVSKLSSSLAGQLAGVVSVQGSGEPGAGASFWIRGISTFGANSRPLILVDGIERPLDLVDPEDIATFSILKDATATAVYGVRGANGIVLITTKRGEQRSRPLINARVEHGFLQPVRMPKLANAEQWIDYYNDISASSSTELPFPDELKEKYLNGTDPDLYPNVDWMNEIFKNTTMNQRLNLNVSGGGNVARYYVSGSFLSENGIFDPQKVKNYDPSVGYKKFNFRSNLDMDLTPSTQLSLSLSNQYETKNRLGVGMGDMYNMVLRTPPIIIPTIYSDGTHAEPLVGRNPYYSLNSTGYSEDFWNTSQSLIGLTQDLSGIITPGLKANIKFSWDAVNESTLDKRKRPATYFATGRDEEGNLIFHKVSDGSDYLSLARSNRGSRTINLESSVTYENLFNETHRVGGLFLFNMREHTNNFPGNYIASFPFRNIGVAARATYSYKDRYFVEGNFGYNGSENFSPGNQFGFFPSLALGYIISNEDYFERFLPIVSLLKLKGSVGEIGNDQIGGNRRFAFNSEMMYSGGYHFGTTGQQWRGGIATGHPGNPNVSWETAIKKNLGIELGLFNKLTLNADYFFEKREGIYILRESVPSVVGINVAQYVNLGQMQNQGVDASLEYSQAINEFIIQGMANFTYNRNKVLYDDKPTPIWEYQKQVGKPLSQQMGLIALGLFESEEDIANSPDQNFGIMRPGDIKYKDINGDGVVDPYDRVAIGYSHIPEISYGFGLSMEYKGVDLSFFFHGVGNVTRIISGSPIRGEAGSILQNGQIYSYIADHRWRQSNPDPNAEYPRMSAGYNENNAQSSTFFQRDMSFMRLKNAEIGYTLPSLFTERFGLSTIRFYAQGVNLLTMSKFDLWDPELSTNYGNVYPQMRTISFGLNIII